MSGLRTASRLDRADLVMVRSATVAVGTLAAGWLCAMTLRAAERVAVWRERRMLGGTDL